MEGLHMTVLVDWVFGLFHSKIFVFLISQKTLFFCDFFFFFYCSLYLPVMCMNAEMSRLSKTQPRGASVSRCVAIIS